MTSFLIASALQGFYVAWLPLDFWGLLGLTIGLLLITSGLTFLRVNGPASWWVYAVMALGVRAFADAEPLDDFESEVDTAEQLETPPVTNED